MIEINPDNLRKLHPVFAKLSEKKQKIVADLARTIAKSGTRTLEDFPASVQQDLTALIAAGRFVPGRIAGFFDSECGTEGSKRSREKLCLLAGAALHTEMLDFLSIFVDMLGKKAIDYYIQTLHSEHEPGE